MTYVCFVVTWRVTQYFSKPRILGIVDYENIIFKSSTSKYCCGGQINIPVPANFWNISDCQRIRQEWQNGGIASKGQTLLWQIVNRKSVRRTVAAAGWWSLEQDLVAGAGLGSWYKTGNRWIGGCWCRTGFCWCRKMVAGSGLVSAGAGRWSLVVSAGVGKWSLVQDW